MREIPEGNVSRNRLPCVGVGDYAPRACIVAPRGFEAMQLHEFCSRDLVTVVVDVWRDGQRRRILLASAYLPHDSPNPPPSMEIERLVQFHEQKGIPLIIGCDANAHNPLWGSSDMNTRGEALEEYLATTDLLVMNRGRFPTFVTRQRQEVLDITLASRDIAREVRDWRVCQEDSLSDHNTIQFSVEVDDSPPTFRRNPRRTNWPHFAEELVLRLGEGKDYLRTTEEVEDEADRLQEALVGAYEAATPLKEVKNRKSSSRNQWWNMELDDLRRESRQARHRAMVTRDWDAYREIQRRYKRTIRSRKTQAWRDFCGDIERTN